MGSDQESLSQNLNRLSLAVSQAVTYFATSPEDLTDDGQTAREVLSHLVFWHREYTSILSALLEDRPLELRVGKFRELNELAYAEFRDQPMQELASLFAEYQTRLELLLESETGSHLRMPVKRGGHAWDIVDLVERVEAHIRGHVLRLKAARRVLTRSSKGR